MEACNAKLLDTLLIDVPHADESTYNVEEPYIPIDPTFHAYLQDHQEDNISQFLALP